MENSHEELKLNMTLNPNAVIAPILKSTFECTENVLFGLKSIDSLTSLQNELLEEDVFFQVRQGYPTDFITQKKNYKEWLLKKGFSDLMEGIKYSLAEANYFISLCNMAENGHIKTTFKAIKQSIAKNRKESLKMHLPELLSEVNKYLIEPLSFGNEIISLNQVRNCLVHRKGMVSDMDLNNKVNSLLKAQWVRLKLFYILGEEEIELTKGHIVKVENANILHKLEKQEKSFSLGEHITFSYQDYNELLVTCYQFGYDLVSKLPKLPTIE